MTANLLRRHGVDSLFRDNTKYIRLMYYKLHLMYRNAVTSPRCPAACGPSNLSPEFSHSFLPPQTRGGGRGAGPDISVATLNYCFYKLEFFNQTADEIIWSRKVTPQK